MGKDNKDEEYTASAEDPYERVTEVCRYPSHHLVPSLVRKTLCRDLTAHRNFL